ncbi:MAG: hypothetical protein HY923_00910 [Elusimicrobia bacterium]|nr:hypothetical protein [Elusimicrobiota bacterium]
MNKLPLFAVLTCLLAANASAQTSVSVNAVRTTKVVVPVLPFGTALGGPGLVSPLATLGMTPTLSAPSLSPAISAPAAAASALAVPALAAQASAKAAVAVPVTAVTAVAAAPAAAKASALSVLSVSAASVSDEKAGPAKLDETFDGTAARKSADDSVSAPAPKARRSLLGRAALAAGALVALPSAALAQTAISAAPVVEPGAMALVLNYGPLATAIAAILGALFGLWSARGKDGSPANAGQALASSISFGAIAGAAAFTLLDLTKVAFLGTAVAAITPLTAAVATAALAQAAFSAKFTDPATTPADRIIGAFPAVAMSFGLGIGVLAFAAPIGLMALATAAVMATGAATALYTALYRPEKSAAAGPAAMGRGVVLQTLMTGMAFAIGPTPYALFFLALGAWGFITVMRTTAQEAWSASEGLRARFKK